MESSYNSNPHLDVNVNVESLIKGYCWYIVHSMGNNITIMIKKYCVGIAYCLFVCCVHGALYG